jgi:hypothetical protein
MIDGDHTGGDYRTSARARWPREAVLSAWCAGGCDVSNAVDATAALSASFHPCFWMADSLVRAD